MKYTKKYTNTEDFKKLVSGEKPVLILYHANWCPHCIMFMGEWNKVETALSKLIYTLQIEHSVLDKLPSKHRKIIAFPTIVLIHKNKRIEYTGQRTALDIVKFVKRSIKVL